MSTHDDQPGEEVPDAAGPDDSEGNGSESDIFEGLLGAFEERGGADLPTVRMSPEEVPGARAGDVIGRYKLRQLIGEGGMGEVWMAERLEDFSQKVALKIIKVGMHTREVVARFHAERQALALMDHPCIARVLDGGATADGHPYFVMDLVQGIPITEFCNRAKMSTRDRLEIFRQVCDAIQHAHQKGVIHRDIKPSNVLVTNLDGRPLPKVIDFGIAKATRQKLTEMSLFTEFGRMIGTPAYMAPEQAVLSAEDVDTRSDVYSLGVLLYELLTGAPPFADQELRKAAFDEMCRVIREVEPPTPSARLSTMGVKAAPVATMQGTDTKHLGKTVEGELDWIVMRALEKDRGRRYQSAAGFGDDVGRHLRGEAVEAGPPSRRYRFKKFARRNKGALAATAAVVLSLAMGLGFSVWKYSDEKEARQQAEEERRLADEAREEAEIAERNTSNVAEFLSDMLAGVGPSKARGRDTTILSEILVETEKRMERELSDQPLVELRLRNTIGLVYTELGEHEKADSNLRRAIALSELADGKDDLRTLQFIRDLARISRYTGDFAEQIRLLEGLLPTLRKQLPESRYQLLSAKAELGDTYAANQDFPRAEKLLREVLGDLDGLNSVDAREFEYRELRYHATKYLGTVCWMQGPTKAGEAREFLLVALASAKDLWGTDHPYYFGCLGELGSAHRVLGELREARRYWEDARKGREMVQDADHPATLAARVAIAQIDLELNPEQAVKELEEVIRDAGYLPPGNPVRTSAREKLAGYYYRSEGDLERAEKLFRANYVDSSALGEDHMHALISLNNAISVLQGRTEAKREKDEDVTELYAQLEADLCKLEESYPATLSPSHNLRIGVHMKLGKTYLWTGRYQEAHKRYQDAVTLLEMKDDPKVSDFVSKIAEWFAEHAEHDEAKRYADWWRAKRDELSAKQ